MSDPPIPHGWMFCCSCQHELSLDAEMIRDRLGRVAALSMGHRNDARIERAAQCTQPDSPLYEKLTNAWRERWGCTLYGLRREAGGDAP